MLRALLASFLTLRGIVTLLGIAALCLLIWFLGPWLELGGVAPLIDESARVLAILCLIGLFFGVVVLRHWLAWRRNRKMIRSLMESESLGALTDNRSSDEVEQIRERFETAMRVMQESSIESSGSAKYLADLPWYIIIGPPGAGKTTILKNSGLQFPLAERLGVDPVSGIGGTRSCDWWFTDQAVLIDTAGRYTTQDVNSDVDRAAWRGFLDLLKAHRRRRPINGVLLAISLSDVLLRSEAERRQQIDQIRKRLLELMKIFGMRVAVYVMFTKSDLISGFSEYFDDLDEDARAQVWGMTLPLDATLPVIQSTVGGQMRALAQNLEDGLLPRMHAERNLTRRGTMFSFPKEFVSLKSSIDSFVTDVFRPSKFEPSAILRGVYFTSGTQEGTPIDRLIGALSRNFGVQGAVRNSFSGRGKAFFINRLLTDVVFEEHGLIGVDRKLERRLATVHTAGYVASIAALLGLGAIWYGASLRSYARIDETTNAGKVTQARLGDIRGLPTFANVLPALDAAKGLTGAAGQGSIFAWLDGMGLSATPTLLPAAEQTYDRILVQQLFPSLVDRFATRLQAGLSSGDTNELNATRELLRVYLMLGDPSRFDRARVAAAARAEAQLAFPLDPVRRAAMVEHIDRLMELLPQPVQLDQRLIASVRARFTREPRVDQIYSRLLSEAQRNARLRQVDLVSFLGSTSLQAGSGAGGGQTTIPGIFTKEGFYGYVLPRLPVLVREERGTDWILASDVGDDETLQRTTRQVAERYVSDYILNWTSAIKGVSSVRFDDLQRGMAIVQGLSDPQSPLVRFIDLVRDNTDLPPPGEPSEKDQKDPQAQAAAAAPSLASLGSTVTGKTKQLAVAQALGDGPWPAKRITDAFRPLAVLAQSDGGQAPPIGRIRDQFGKLFGAMSGVSTAPEPSLAAYQIVQKRVKDPNNDAFASLRTEAIQRPEPVRAILNDITRSAWGIMLDLAARYVDESWKKEVLPICQTAIFQRYPIYPNSKDDISLRDFADFFRPGGTVDDFFTKYMAPLVVDQRSRYVAARIDGAAVPFRPDSLAQFQRARVIRGAFFSASAQAPSVKFSIRPIFLHPQVLRAVMNIDGRDIVYRHEAQRAYEVEWPTKSDSSTVSVILTTTDNQEIKADASGPWSLFRLVDNSRLASRGTADRYSFAVGRTDGPNIVYELRAASVSNPFSLDTLRGFRCPDQL